jgi:hypothetical protein
LHQKEGKTPRYSSKIKNSYCTKSHSHKIKTLLYKKFLFAPKGRPKPPEVYAILSPHTRNSFLHQKAGKKSINSSKFKQIQAKLIKKFGKFWLYFTFYFKLSRPISTIVQWWLGLACVFASEINLLLLASSQPPFPSIFSQSWRHQRSCGFHQQLSRIGFWTELTVD